MKVKANGTDFVYFNDTIVELTLDAVASTFSFTGRFNPNNRNHRALFQPLGFPEIQIIDDDDTLLLTGTVINSNQKSQAEPELTTLSGYSKTGVLNDCTIPLRAYPLESLNRSLREIAQKLLGVFQLGMVVDASVRDQMDVVYAKTVAEPTDTIVGYLSKLAAQRNIVLSHTPDGRILFYRPNAAARPSHSFTKANVRHMGWTIQGQALHSHIAVLTQPGEDNPNANLADEVTNPLVGTFRPTVAIMSDGTAGETKRAADNKMAAELKNIALIIRLDTYHKAVPGEIAEVVNPDIHLSLRTRFMISKVVYKNRENGDMTLLTLVLPETYTGETPKLMFT